MAIPKKGSRRIVVDGTIYRWRVRGRATYCQSNAWTGLILAVEQAEEGGAVLVVNLPHAHPDNWMGEPFACMTPVEVERHIQEALAAGWKPTEPGKTFEM